MYQIKNYIVILALLLSKNSIDKIKKELNKLKYSEEEIRKVVFLVSLLTFDVNKIISFERLKNISKITDEEIKYFCNHYNIDSKVVNAILKYKSDNDFTASVLNRLKIKLGVEYGNVVQQLEVKRFNKLLK